MRSILLFLVVGLVHGSLVFPPPTNGKWGTDIKNLELIDHNRTDPYDPDGRPRRLMLSVIYPTLPIHKCNPNNTVPYAPKAVLDVLVTAFEMFGSVTNISDKVHQLAISTCPSPSSQLQYKEAQFPVLIFSPGLHGSRFLSLSQAQSIASQGYNIILLDHAYDTAIIEFPNGDIVTRRNFTTVEELDELVRVRVEDVSFVIDQLEDKQSPLGQLLSDENCEIGIYGHSLGGATSILASYLDSRIKAIVDLDGYPYGFNTAGTREDPVFHLPSGLDTPTLLFTNSTAPLGSIWDSFTGWKKRLTLKGGTHTAFTDLPLLVDVLDLREKLPVGFVEDVVGEIEGVRARDVVGEYVGAFFDRFLKGMDG
ncbi:putative 1-alkyl-2-acetylglycerophosphocholine esterase, partial [Pseudocercospora fuligena]